MLLDSRKIKFNIILISQTFLQEYNKDLYNIENDNVFNITRNNFINNKYDNNEGGGNSIFIQNHLYKTFIQNIYSL